MNEELKEIRSAADWADSLCLGGIVMRLCDYIAGLEERLEKLEDRHQPAKSVEIPARGPRTFVIDEKEITQ